MDLQLKKSKNPTMNHLIHFGIYSTANYAACFSLNTFAFVPSMKNAVLYPAFSPCNPTTTGVGFVIFQFFSWLVSLTGGYLGCCYREGALKLKGKHIVTSFLLINVFEKAGVWIWEVKGMVPRGGEEMELEM